MLIFFPKNISLYILAACFCSQSQALALPYSKKTSPGSQVYLEAQQAARADIRFSNPFTGNLKGKRKTAAESSCVLLLPLREASASLSNTSAASRTPGTRGFIWNHPSSNKVKPDTQYWGHETHWVFTHPILCAEECHGSSWQPSPAGNLKVTFKSTEGFATWVYRLSHKGALPDGRSVAYPPSEEHVTKHNGVSVYVWTFVNIIQRKIAGSHWILQKLEAQTAHHRQLTSNQEVMTQHLSVLEEPPRENSMKKEGTAEGTPQMRAGLLSQEDRDTSQGMVRLEQEAHNRNTRASNPSSESCLSLLS